MKKEFTPEQLQAINEERSCVVSAGAGSGKTTVLAQRFACLVSGGIDCNRILTITFTRKAAAEMKSRIRAELAAKGLTDQLAIFHTARISTVDSFCQEIVRSDCRRYGIPGNFRIAPEREMNTASRRIAEDLLIKQAQSPAGRYLLALADPSEAVKLLCRVSRETNLVHPMFGETSHQVLVDLARTTKEQLEYELEQEFQNFLTDQVILGDPNLANDVKAAGRCLEDLKAGNIRAVLEVAFSRKKAVISLKRKTYENAKLLYVCKGILENTESIAAVYSLISRYETLVNDYKRRSGVLSFADCMKMSIDILLTQKKTRQFYKNAFSQVMIDEFQDNNDDYRCLLYLLSEKKDLFTHGIPRPEDLEEGKIFLVGDEKQSIYRFRGADVSVFKRMQEEITRCGGTMIELDKNFRTNRPLLENLNNLFSGAMAGSTADFEARFRDLKPGKDNNLKSRAILHINVHPYRDDKSEGLAGYEASEAASLADLILEMTGTDGFLIDRKKGPERPTFSDIAILLRTASDQADYEKALRLRNIPYVLSQQKDLVREALVNDFYSLLNLAVYRNDGLCRESVANGPFGPSAAEPEVLDRIGEKTASAGIAGALEYLWHDLGYRAFIISNPANQVYTEHYLNLYSIAASYDNQLYSLTDFLDYLKDAIDSGKTDEKESNVLSDRTDGVKIMTIHGSKGLEFPIVIIAGMEAGLGSDNSSLKLMKDREGNPYVSASFNSEGRPANLYNNLNGDLETRMEKAEMVRIFYVAATRAMQHIVFSGSPASTTLAEPEKKSLMALFALSTGMRANKDACTLIDIPSWVEYRPFARIREEETYSTSRMDRNAIEAFRPWYESAVEDSFDWSEKSVAVTSLGEQDRRNRHGRVLKSLASDAFIREKELQTEFGTYVHALIEDAINGTQTEHEVPESLSGSQAAMFREDARTLCKAFIDSALYKELKEGNYELFPERSFRMYDTERNVLLKGTVDLLAVGTDNVRVIDFKTDIIRDEEEHRIQLETYSKAVSSIYPGRSVNPAVFYLRDPDNVLVRNPGF